MSKSFNDGHGASNSQGTVNGGPGGPVEIIITDAPLNSAHQLLMP